MASRLRNFLDSIVYAGMKPGKPRSESKRMRLLGPLRAPAERWLSGGARQDPLYLSNRTLGQRVLGWVKIGVPLLVVVVAVIVAFGMHHRSDKPAEILSPAEIAAKMLPELNRPIHVDTNTDIEVLEVFIDHAAGDKLLGKLRNATSHTIQTGEVDFVLTAVSGTQVGSVAIKVNKMAAGQTVPFSQPIAENGASSAQVREVRTR